MAKSGDDRKKDKDLESILERIKQTYSQDTEIDLDENDSEGEVDTELAAMLNQVFASPSASKSDNEADSLDDEIAEDEIIEDEVIEDEIIEDEVIEDEIVEDEIIEDEIVEDEIIEDEIVEDEVIEDEVIEDEIVEDEIVEDEIVEDEIVEDEVVEDEIIEDDTFEDAAVADGEDTDEYFSTSGELNASDIDEVQDEDTLSDPAYRRIYGEDINEEPEAPMITDPEMYVYDPLQYRLPSIQLPSDPDRDDLYESDSIDIDEGSFDRNDVSLLLKFGYDAEVKSKIGEEETRRVIFEDDEKFTPEIYQTPFGYCGKEFTDREQIPEISAKYKSDKRSLIIRLSIVSAIALLILAVDIFFDFFSSRSSYAILLAFELVLVAASAAVIYKKLYSGLMAIVRFEANRYSPLVAVMLMYALYDITSLIIYAVTYKSIDTSSLAVFGFPTALYAIITLISDILICTKDDKVFKVISSTGSFYAAEKQAVIVSDTVDSTEKQDEGSVHNESIASRRSTEKNYKVIRTSLIRGYFRRMSRSDAGSVNLIYILGVVPIISIIVGCISAIAGSSISNGVSVIMLTYLLCTPLSYIFMSSASDYILSNKITKRNAAFIGLEATDEYAQPDRLTFKDTDAIEVISYTEIQPNKSKDIDKYTDIAYEILRSLGGPLAKIAPAESENEKHHVISINSISANGINIYYDSSVNVLIGDRSYMSFYKIKVKTDNNLTAATKSPESSVIYMAFDGAPKLGFIVNSKIKASFAQAVAALDENNIRVFVESYEPQINENYFDQNLKQKARVSGVNKPSKFDMFTVNGVCDSAVIAPTAPDIAQTILLGNKISEKRRHNRYIHFLTVTIGIVLSVILSLIINSAFTSGIIYTFKLHISFILSLFLIFGSMPSYIRIFKLNKHNIGDNEKK